MSLGSDFDVDLLSLWLNDDIERTFDLRSFRLQDIDLSVEGLEDGNIVRVVGFRDASGAMAVQDTKRSIDAIRAKYPGVGVDVVLSIARAAEQANLIMSGIFYFLDGEPRVGGGYFENTGDYKAVRKRLVVALSETLGSSFKCNTRSLKGIGCCDGPRKQAPQQ